MKSLYPSKGYTIIEVLIFLTISAALFGSIVGSMIQQTKRSEFTQSIDGLQVRLQDVLNDVSTGLYPSNGQIKCEYAASGPDVSSVATTQGANVGCIFVGKAIHFEPGAADVGTYNIYTIIGNRQKAVGPTKENVANFLDAKPEFLGVGSNAGKGIVESGALLPGIEITKVINLNSPTPDIGGFAIISTFAKKDDVTQTVSGNASRVELMATRTLGLNASPTAYAAIIGNPSGMSGAPKGILICIQELVSERKASITIGGDGQSLNLERTIDSWPTGLGPDKCST